MSDTLYKIIYRDAETGKPLTIHANNIEDSPLGFGFVKVSGLLTVRATPANIYLFLLEASRCRVRYVEASQHGEM